MTSRKEKEIMLDIVKVYKDLPYLWQKNHKDYFNKELRTEAFMDMLEIYRKLQENATLKMIKKKVENMRTNYIKELKKVKEARLTRNRLYIPTLWYYNSLKFLESESEISRPVKEHLKPDPELQTADVGIDQINNATNAEQSQTTKMPRRRKKVAKTIDKKPNHGTDAAEKRLQERTMKEEEWEVLGKSIGLQLRDLNKKQLTITQKLISDAIYYAKIGSLTENSSIALAPSPTPPNPSAPHTDRYQRTLYSRSTPYSNRRRSSSPRSATSSSPVYYDYSDTLSPRPSPSPQHQTFRQVEQQDPLHSPNQSHFAHHEIQAYAVQTTPIQKDLVQSYNPLPPTDLKVPSPHPLQQQHHLQSSHIVQTQLFPLTVKFETTDTVTGYFPDFPNTSFSVDKGDTKDFFNI